MVQTLRKISFYMLILALVALIGLAVLVHYHGVFGLDIFLSRDLQSEGDSELKRSFLLHILAAVSYFGKPLIAAILLAGTAIIFWIFKFYRETVFTLLVPVASAINAIAKLIINRPRPSAQLIQILDRETDPSFPSGHVVFYTVFFGFIIAVMAVSKRIPLWLRITVSAISFALIVTVSISRVYLGAHWFSDILGGYLLGFVLLLILLNFYLAPYLKPKSK